MLGGGGGGGSLGPPEVEESNEHLKYATPAIKALIRKMTWQSIDGPLRHLDSRSITECVFLD